MRAAGARDSYRQSHTTPTSSPIVLGLPAGTARPTPGRTSFSGRRGSRCSASARFVSAASASTTTSPGCSAAMRTRNSAAEPGAGSPCARRCSGGGVSAGPAPSHRSGAAQPQEDTVGRVPAPTSASCGLVFPKPSAPCTKSAMRSLAAPRRLLCAPSTTGTCGQQHERKHASIRGWPPPVVPGQAARQRKQQPINCRRRAHVGAARQVAQRERIAGGHGGGHVAIHARQAQHLGQAGPASEVSTRSTQGPHGCTAACAAATIHQPGSPGC